MFTGIIERTGTVAARRAGRDGGLDLAIRAPGLALGPGDSIAVDGVCLTAVRPRPGRFLATLSPETIARSTLGRAGVGALVNLERPLGVGDRLGGHFVLGHVDARGRVEALEPEGDGARLVISAPRRYDRWVVEKGSLAVNGVSLTIAAAGPGRFEVALIPFTLEVTNLGRLRPGSPVNLEFDYLAKLVAAAVEAHTSQRGGGGRPGEEETDAVRQHGASGGRSEGRPDGYPRRRRGSRERG